MNQSDSRGSVGHSADLRTRIAAAIRAVDDMRVCKLHDADIKFITEAVIRELEPELNRHNQRFPDPWVTA